MTPALRTYFVNQLKDAIETIGPTFEAFGQRMMDAIAADPLIHPGLNSLGHPVGHAVDSVSSDGTLVAEYTTEAASFSAPFWKMLGDFKHARTKHRGAKTIHFLSSRECGPSARTKIANLAGHARKRTGIEFVVWDSRRLAEHIVDHLLLNDAVVDQLVPYLGPLQRIRDEYAATNLLPEAAPGYLARPAIESQLLAETTARKTRALVGISGSGKSQLAAAVGRAARASFDMVVWLPATSIRHLSELNGIDIERRGHKVNLLHLLRSRSCFLVLDDLWAPLDAAMLASSCGSDSAILITRQVAAAGDFRIPQLDRIEAEAILNDGATQKCPTEQLQRISRAVGGHPLALRLLNAAAKVASWDEVAAECSAIDLIHDESKTQSLFDRLLARIQPLLRRELAFFQWSGSHRADRGLARHLLGPLSVHRMDEYCLLASDRADVLRLHDIVATSVQRMGSCPEELAKELEAGLVTYIRHLTMQLDDDLCFHNFCDVHRGQLEYRAKHAPQRAPYLCCLFQTWHKDEAPTTLADYPASATAALVAAGGPVDEMAAYAIIEATEALYRWKKRAGQDEAARQIYKAAIPHYDALLQARGLPIAAQTRILHHKAKALRALGDDAQGLVICRDLMTRPSPASATKLLLARLLAASPEGSTESKTLLFALLRDAQTTRGKCEVSVALAAFTDLAQSNAPFDELWAEFGALIGAWIVDSAIRGLDQAYHAFAVCANNLQWKDPEQLRLWVAQLPPVPLDPAMSGDDRAAWGKILLSLAQAETNSEGATSKSEGLLLEALHFFESVAVPDLFLLRQKAKALHLLERHEEAEAVLGATDRAQWSAFEHYDYSKILDGLQRSDAFDYATTAIAKLRPNQEKFQAAFFNHRATVGRRLQRKGWREDLQRAHDLTRDKKFKAELAKKLAETAGESAPASHARSC